MTARRNRLRILWIILAAAVLLFAAGTVYVSDYYHASPAAAGLLSGEIPGIAVTAEKDRITFRPEEARAGRQRFRKAG